MEALGDWFPVVPAREVLAARRTPAAAVTLDDGYLDNLEEAVPVLRDLSLPATFFVVADALADGSSCAQEYWWDRLEHLLLEHGRGSTGVTLRIGARRLVLDLSDPLSRRTAYLRVSSALHRQPPGEVRRVLTALEAARPRGAACDRHRRMSADQVRQLAAEPLFDIGSHTCTHAALAHLPRTESRRELTRSRDVLGELLGKAPDLLAYPYGAPGTVSRRDAREARAAGYQLAFANVAGPVEGADPFAVPRITVGRWSVDHLRQAVTAWRPAA
jgi:peptidoglycan/xylan/chitin deacetylase (PgdA/CDA1 family)